jgi:Fic-DOC domain mobile mystery protein B
VGVKNRLKRIFNEPNGATPINDLSGLIPQHITTLPQLFIVEARNISKAVTKYLASAPSKRKASFTLSWAYKLHAEMFGDVWEWAGRRRTGELNIGVPAHQIEPSLKNLLDDLVYWYEHNTYSLIEQATRVHHRAVYIHPFKNGNGRWARLLANIWLKRCRYEPVSWPEEHIKNESTIRREYLDAVKAADKQDYAPLLLLHNRYSSEDGK